MNEDVTASSAWMGLRSYMTFKGRNYPAEFETFNHCERSATAFRTTTATFHGRISPMANVGFMKFRVRERDLACNRISRQDLLIYLSCANFTGWGMLIVERVLRAKSGKIVLTADVQSKNYSCNSLPSLWQQYFEYGLYKVRVLQKHPWQMRPRQFIPLIFVKVLSGGFY